MRNALQFADPNYVMFGKLLLAMILGGIIGTERAILAKQNAGTRTFGLVSLGACLFVLTANFVDTAYLGLVDFNPTFVAAAVVSGIGFIGGGLIIFKNDALHGVTTAAGLWLAAGIGMAVGYGIFAVAVFATILTLTMLTGMWYIENRFKHWFQDHQDMQNEK